MAQTARAFKRTREDPGSGEVSAVHRLGLYNNIDADNFATDVWTPEADKVHLITVLNSWASTNDAIPAPSGNGLTFTQVGSSQAFGANRRLTVFRAIGAAPTTGATSFTFGGLVQTGCIWCVDELTGTDNGNGGADALRNPSFAADDSATASLTLPAFDTVDNGAYCSAGTSINSAPEQKNPGPPAWTQVNLDNKTAMRGSGPTNSLGSGFYAGNDTAPLMTFNTGPWGFFATELVAEVVPPSTIEEWWDGAGWVTEETFITSTAEEFVFAANSWAVGDYEWTVATKDSAGEAGPYTPLRAIRFQEEAEAAKTGWGVPF